MISIFGEHLVGKAYFGDFDTFEELMNSVDARLGPGAFVRLLQLSDQGDWKQVFMLLK